MASSRSYHPTNKDGTNARTCPLCDGETEVLETREIGSSVFRRRRCQQCGNTYSTFEIYADEWEFLMRNNKERREEKWED